ncbi:MAG: Crp/Fnr family transcriptional regulator [Actinomycetota bacterium]
MAGRSLDDASRRAIPLFQGLDQHELARLRAITEVTTYPAGVRLMQERQPGEVVYVILSGSVKVHHVQADGTEVILAVLGEKEIVGELSMIDGFGRSATVSTLEETRTLWLDREGFWECIRDMPVLSHNLHRLMARRLRRANAHIDSLASLDVAGRIARHLLALAYEYGRPADGRGTLIPIPLSQADLAALVGASRARVNQALVEFRRRRYVSLDRNRYTVLDPEALRRRCL